MISPFGWHGLAVAFVAGWFGIASAANLPWREPTAAERMEEPAGGQASLIGGDRVLGVSIGSGTWLKNTWIFGDYEASTFLNGEEDTLYGGLGMTLRLMPRWRVAPFLGIGGAYHQSLSGGGDDEIEADGTVIKRGDSHFAALGEAGLRIHQGDRFFDFALRYVLPDLAADDAEYGYLRLGYGFPLGR
jgi:hypothetical protein